MDQSRRAELQSFIEKMQTISEELLRQTVESGLASAVESYGHHLGLMRLFPQMCTSHLALDRDFTQPGEWRLSRLHAYCLRIQLEQIYGPDVIERLISAGQSARRGR